MRTPQDMNRLIELGAHFASSRAHTKNRKTVAFQKKAEVDDAYLRLMKKLLDDSTYPAIATHDAAMIEATKAYAAEKGYAKTASSSRCSTASAAICKPRS